MNIFSDVINFNMDVSLYKVFDAMDGFFRWHPELSTELLVTWNSITKKLLLSAQQYQIF